MAWYGQGRHRCFSLLLGSAALRRQSTSSAAPRSGADVFTSCAPATTPFPHSPTCVKGRDEGTAGKPATTPTPPHGVESGQQQRKYLPGVSYCHHRSSLPGTSRHMLDQYLACVAGLCRGRVVFEMCVRRECIDFSCWPSNVTLDKPIPLPAQIQGSLHPAA